MAKYGLLIDYNFCSGCRTCEIACQQENGYDSSKHGLHVSTLGPIPLDGGRWQFDNVPLMTSYCSHCATRVSKGKRPACVHHCQSGCIEFGEIKDLSARLTSQKMVLYLV